MSTFIAFGFRVAEGGRGQCGLRFAAGSTNFDAQRTVVDFEIDIWMLSRTVFQFSISHRNEAQRGWWGRSVGDRRRFKVKLVVLHRVVL